MSRTEICHQIVIDDLPRRCSPNGPLSPLRDIGAWLDGDEFVVRELWVAPQEGESVLLAQAELRPPPRVTPMPRHLAAV
jgi:hypothetical protein